MGMFDIIRDPTYVGGDTHTFETTYSRLKEDSRFDADRFDPKFDEFFKRIKKAGKVVRLGDWLTERAKRGAQPAYDANGSIYVINSQQIHSDKIDMESCSMTTPEWTPKTGQPNKV